jgi:hypothetical protein
MSCSVRSARQASLRLLVRENSTGTVVTARPLLPRPPLTTPLIFVPFLVRGLVGRLEPEALVERTMCENDRRSVWVRATEAGRERLAAARPTHRTVLRQQAPS